MYDRFLTKKGRLDPVQKTIALATRNAAKCPDCHIEAELLQSYGRPRLEYSLKVTILPCPKHQPDIAVAFTDPSKPSPHLPVTIGQARKIAGLPPLPTKKTDPMMGRRRR